jgi:hypothetical protein
MEMPLHNVQFLLWDVVFLPGDNFYEGVKIPAFGFTKIYCGEPCENPSKFDCFYLALHMTTSYYKLSKHKVTIRIGGTGL